MKIKNLLEKMDVIANELVGSEELYQIFTKCMAEIDNLKTYDPYTNTWDYAY